MMGDAKGGQRWIGDASAGAAAAAPHPDSPTGTAYGTELERSAAAKTNKRLSFSHSVTMVCVGTLSFICWMAYLCQETQGPAAVEFYSQVPATVYMWPMVAFATSLLLNLLAWTFERRPQKAHLNFLAVYISGVAFGYEFLAWMHRAPIYVTGVGRPISLLRYLMWAHATPAMLLALSLMSTFSRQRVARVIAVDLVMILTAVPGELIPTWHRWVWNFISCAAFPYVLYNLYMMYDTALAEAGDEAAQVSLRVLRNFTCVFWSIFPLVWAAVQCNMVSIFTEEVLWSCADICGKIFFASTLLHGNFLTIEHRRLMAMRIVEEANRVKVIHELRELVEQKEQFIALMSHELRTPLNGIIGLSNAMLMDTKGISDENCKTISTISNSGARLLNILNDILDAVAMRKGKLVVQPSKMSLGVVADDVISLCTPLAKPGVKLSSRISPKLPPLWGDTARVVQVLYNVVGNACKFTERGEIWVDATQVGDVVAVHVHDTGIGIPEDRLEDIFAPFEQVDMSITRKYGGTGLGLNLAKQLVEAHGGTISAASQRGQGSCFTFTLKVWHEGEPCPVPLANGGPAPSLLTNGAGDHAAAARSSGSSSSPSECQPIKRSQSSADMQQRLSHDANPTNMLTRLSEDSKLRHSFEQDNTSYKKAPQQLTPQVAASAFFTASAHPVVAEIQHGNIEAHTLRPAAARAQKAEVDRQEEEDRVHEPLVEPTWLSAEAVVERATATGKVTVLSVDDSHVNQLVVQQILTKLGLHVVMAGDGQKALDILGERVDAGLPPDVILLDVMMPGLSGYDVARRIRQLYPAQMLPIIMVSANNQEEHVVEGLAAGAQDYVRKPFAQKELVARIKAQLRIKQFTEAVARAAPAGTAPANVGTPLALGPAPGINLPNVRTTRETTGTDAPSESDQPDRVTQLEAAMAELQQQLVTKQNTGSVG